MIVNCVQCGAQVIGRGVMLMEAEAQRDQGVEDGQDYFAFRGANIYWTQPVEGEDNIPLRYVVLHPIHLFEIIETMMRGETTTVFTIMFGNMADVFGEEEEEHVG